MTLFGPHSVFCFLSVGFWAVSTEVSVMSVSVISESVMSLSVISEPVMSVSVISESVMFLCADIKWCRQRGGGSLRRVTCQAYDTFVLGFVVPPRQ